MGKDQSAGGAGFAAAHSVGWVGAGKMGAPMIRNLLARGVAVTVSEPMRAVVAELAEAGAIPAAVPADLATCAIVFATLPNDAALLEVVLGTTDSAGLAAVMPAGAVFVEMSTVSPECSVRIAKALSDKGILYLRAPISGSTALAEKAALTILASGDQAAWTAALLYLEMMSARRFYLGPSEQARYMKLVLNALVGATSSILAEALALGASGGLSRADMMGVICESVVASPLLAYKRDAVVADDFTPAFTVAQMVKDFTLISDAGRTQGVPLLTIGLILELYRAAANTGLKDDDFFALVKWQANMSN